MLCYVIDMNIYLYIMCCYTMSRDIMLSSAITNKFNVTLHYISLHDCNLLTT